MHLSDRLLRKEIAQLRQTFVPLSGNLDLRSRDFFLALNDLCMATKVRADGMLLLHVAGETNTAELVRGLLPNVGA